MGPIPKSSSIDRANLMTMTSNEAAALEARSRGGRDHGIKFRQSDVAPPALALPPPFTSHQICPKKEMQAVKSDKETTKKHVEGQVPLTAETTQMRTVTRRGCVNP